MAGQILHQVLERARKVIAAITPDYEPDLRFLDAPYTAPLHKQAMGSMPDGGTRRFHALPALVSGSGGGMRILTVNGAAIFVEDHISVQIRYHVPQRNDEGLKRFSAFLADDAPRITQTLVEMLESGSEEESISYISPSSSQLQSIGDEDLYILTLTYAIRYWVAH